MAPSINHFHIRRFIHDRNPFVFVSDFQLTFKMQFLVAIPLVLISLTSISTADPVVDCRSSGPKVNSTTLSQAVASIGSFCDKDNGLKFWNLTFVSPVSMGQNHPDRLSAVDLNTPFSNDLGPNNLWLRVSFKEGSCVGSFPFTYGPNDAAKKQTCIDNFMPILNQVCLSAGHLQTSPNSLPSVTQITQTKSLVANRRMCARCMKWQSTKQILS